jgi:hypothetical protein
MHRTIEIKTDAQGTGSAEIDAPQHVERVIPVGEPHAVVGVEVSDFGRKVVVNVAGAKPDSTVVVGYDVP